MVSASTATAIVGLVASLLASALVWHVFDTALLFLVVPFVPLLLRRGADAAEAPTDVMSCPSCGFETREPGFEYCPRDGSRLRPRQRA